MIHCCEFNYENLQHDGFFLFNFSNQPNGAKNAGNRTPVPGTVEFPGGTTAHPRQGHVARDEQVEDRRSL